MHNREQGTITIEQAIKNCFFLYLQVNLSTCNAHASGIVNKATA